MACMYKRNRDRQQAKAGSFMKFEVSGMGPAWIRKFHTNFHTKMPTTARETSTQYNRVWLGEQRMFQSHSPHSKVASVCQIQQKMSKPQIPTHKHPASSFSSFIKLLTLSLRLTQSWSMVVACAWSRDHHHSLVSAGTAKILMHVNQPHNRARTGPHGPGKTILVAIRSIRCRSPRCAAADFRGSFFVDVMSVTCIFLSFFLFFQFFGRLGELVDLQRYGPCEIFDSKAKSKGLRN